MERDNLKTNIKLIYDDMHKGEGEPNPTYTQNWDKFRKFMDNEMIPLRIEQSLITGNLYAEQIDLNNKNKTLTKHQKAQLDVIDRIIGDFNNKTYSSLRNFQSLDYKINEKKFQARFLKYSFILVSFIFILVGLGMMDLIPKEIIVGVSVIFILLYFTVLYLNIKQNMHRYKYDWEKIYWKPPEYKKKTCQSDTWFFGLF